MSISPEQQPRLGTADDGAPYVDIARRFELGDIDGAACASLTRRAWSKQHTLLPKGLFDAILVIMKVNDPTTTENDHQMQNATRALIGQYAELKNREAVGKHRGGAWTLPDGDVLYDIAAVPQGTTREIIPYLTVVRSFVDGSIDANTFQHDYLDLQRNERWFTPDGLYPIMQEIFYAIEDYVEFDHLRDPGELDADQLRARMTELEPELIARFEDARRREADDASGGD